MNGKDFMKSKYTYDELVSAYDNFLAPVLEIYVGGGTKDVISSKEIAIDNVQITLSVESASSLTFQIINAFELPNYSVKSDVKNSFSVGKIVKAALGYGSNLTTVFMGYVTEFRTVYQTTPTVSVTAVDLRKLLMQNQRENYKYEKQKYSAVFSTILNGYSKLYENLHVEEVNSEEEFLQNGSDYQFIKEVLCNKAQKDFYVVGGEVYFQTPESASDAFLTLEWGKNLISFQRGKGYCYKEIKVSSGGEDKTGSEVCEVVKTDADTPSLTAKTQLQAWTVQSDMDTNILNNCLDKKVQEEKQKNDTGTGNTIGLPELVPGRYIEIDGVDSEDAGTYYITGVTHNFGGDGFTSSFSLGNHPTLVAPERNSSKREKAGQHIGVVRAVVKENWNEEYPGKVKVEFLTGEKGKKSTSWLPVAQPYCGKGYGFYFHPEIDTEVVVGSQMGDANDLIVLGALWNKVDEPPADAPQENNFIKKIRTKGNHEILFDDNEESTGIRITTGNGIHIELSDKNQHIFICDSEEKNGIQIDMEGGCVKLQAEKKIVMSVGNKDMLVLDGDNKKLSMETDTIEEKGSTKITMKTQKLETNGDTTELKASSSFKINSSAMVEVKAGSSMKINSSGITEIKGAMVKVN